MCGEPDWAYCDDPMREAMDYEFNAYYDRYDGWRDDDPWGCEGYDLEPEAEPYIELSEDTEDSGCDDDVPF